jgi:hypothetical protein
MEPNQISNPLAEQEAATKIYNYAASLMIDGGKDAMEVKDMLVAKGMDDSTAYSLVTSIEDEIHKAKKNRGQKDMLYGALWCIGGIVLTAAHIGFIFWGAILFGGIQFIKGLVTTLSD